MSATGTAPGDIGAAYSYAWAKFQQNGGTLILAMLIAAVGYIVGSVFAAVVRGAVHGSGLFTELFVYAVSEVLVFAISGAFQIGVYRAALAITAGQPIEFAGLFSSENLGPYIATHILYSIGVGIGFLLCVIPGLAFGFLAFLAPFYVLDQQMSPVDAIRESIRATSSNAGALIVFAIVTVLVYILGLVACIVGILIAAPVALVAIAYTYRNLNGQAVAA